MRRAGPNPLPPSRMMPCERRAELCMLLATGLVRLARRKRAAKVTGPADFPTTHSADVER